MTISYPLNTPTSIGIANIELSATNAVAVSRSPFTFSQQVHTYPGQMWSATVTIPPLRKEFVEPWVAFLLALRGQTGTFLLGDPNNVTPRGVATGTPLVNNGSAISAGSFVIGTRYEIATLGDTDWVSIGASSATVGVQFLATGTGSGTGTVTESQTGGTLEIDGATVSTTGWLKAGDYIQLGAASSATLHKVLLDADSDASGNVTLEIWPYMRTAPADNAAVTVSNCKGVFRLATNTQSWSINESSAYGLQFDAMEAVV